MMNFLKRFKDGVSIGVNAKTKHPYKSSSAEKQIWKESKKKEKEYKKRKRDIKK